MAIDVGTLAGTVSKRRCRTATCYQKRAAAECDGIGTARNGAGSGTVKVIKSAQSQARVAVCTDKSHNGYLACTHMLSMHTGNIRIR